MFKTKVFVSFDFEKDRQYKYMLNAWSENSAFKFTFEDHSSGEIQSSSVSVVKNVLSRKINEASAVIVIIGQDADKLHRDWREIGYRNWQNYEVAKAKELGKKLIAVQIDSRYQYPEELLDANAMRVFGFRQADIMRAIRGW